MPTAHLGLVTLGLFKYSSVTQLWRYVAFTVGAILFQNAHVQNRRILAWEGTQSLVTTICSLGFLKAWDLQVSVTFHLQPVVNWEPFGNIFHILMSAAKYRSDTSLGSPKRCLI